MKNCENCDYAAMKHKRCYCTKSDELMQLNDVCGDWQPVPEVSSQESIRAEVGITDWNDVPLTIFHNGKCIAFITLTREEAEFIADRLNGFAIDKGKKK